MRHRVDDDAGWFDFTDAFGDGSGERVFLDCPGIEDVVRLVVGERTRFGREIEDGDPVDVEADGRGVAPDIGFGLFECAEETVFAPLDAVDEVREGEEGFSRAGLATEHVAPPGNETTVEDFVEAGDPGTRAVVTVVGQ